MTGFIASYLVRMYPRTWRMRYEEEIRALLEDSPPTWRDIAGLASAAVNFSAARAVMSTAPRYSLASGAWQTASSLKPCGSSQYVA